MLRPTDAANMGHLVVCCRISIMEILVAQNSILRMHRHLAPPAIKQLLPNSQAKLGPVCCVLSGQQSAYHRSHAWPSFDIRIVAWQVLPDITTWEYKGQQKVLGQHCNLWELQQRYVPSFLLCFVVFAFSLCPCPLALLHSAGI